MTEMSQILLVVAGALIDADGRVLMQSRPPGRSMAGLWEFPGGKIDGPESPEAALARELREELGLLASPDDMMAATFASAPLGDRFLLLNLYLIRKWSGNPTPLEGQSVQWVMPGDLAALDMPPADYPLAERLCELLRGS